MHLQSATIDHLPSCATLFQAVFAGEPWNEAWPLPVVTKRLTELYTTPGFYGLVAIDEASLLGFVLGYLETWHQGQVYYLKEMCVDAATQRHGIGTALMQALVEHLSTHAVQRIYLLTVQEGIAETFYRKQGFYVSRKMIMMSKRL